MLFEIAIDVLLNKYSIFKTEFGIKSWKSTWTIKSMAWFWEAEGFGFQTDRPSLESLLRLKNFLSILCSICWHYWILFLVWSIVRILSENLLVCPVEYHPGERERRVLQLHLPWCGDWVYQRRLSPWPLDTVSVWPDLMSRLWCPHQWWPQKVGGMMIVSPCHLQTYCGRTGDCF